MQQASIPQGMHPMAPWRVVLRGCVHVFMLAARSVARSDSVSAAGGEHSALR